MSKLFSKISAFFRNKDFMGVDKAGNRYFARKEEIDGVSKWVLIFFIYLYFTILVLDSPFIIIICLF